MYLTRENFEPLAENKIKDKIYIDIKTETIFKENREKKEYSYKLYNVNVIGRNLETSIETKIYRDVWVYIEQLYNIFIKSNIILIVRENNTNTILSFGIGKARILEKIKSIEIKDVSIKRMSNIKRRMVVDTPYKSTKKKIDMRIFNRKNYASSSNKGV